MEEHPHAQQPCSEGTLHTPWPRRAKGERGVPFPTGVIQRLDSEIPPCTHSWEEKETSPLTAQVPRSVFMQPPLREQCSVLLTKPPSSPLGRAPGFPDSRLLGPGALHGLCNTPSSRGLAHCKRLTPRAVPAPASKSSPTRHTIV